MSASSRVLEGHVEGARQEREAPRGGRTQHVEPIVRVQRDAAYKGVYWRLVGAALSGFVTAGALGSLMFLTLAPFVWLIAIVFAGAFGLVTITLAMSARREEEVHQLATSLLAHRDVPAVKVPPQATDGNIDRS